ncbi:EKC/KEOPS complex subunit Tprkb-like [Daphnia carinata]|uniref:EKC/KEOPS complex subunit Tprkb-like n=1 Tax=Daphnia carinata TaxID=120202 RepID=UPI00257EA3E3|nr:EKC/KEOPS complex subunit Tprkb-like [Daphnia carinata]XP_059351696.1 EKC/KEOPS complex subunit Tprkb-like [Daphnia carinata]
MLSFKEYEPKLLLFKNVTNAGEVRERIIKANLPCAAINPRYVFDTFQVLVATQLAVMSQQNKALRTHSVFSEIVYNMSPTRKISDSLKIFGMSEKDTSVLCVVLSKEDMELVCSEVKGELTNPAESNFGICDEDELRKIYKIKEVEMKTVSLLDSIINKISTKEIITA